MDFVRFFFHLRSYKIVTLEVEEAKVRINELKFYIANNQEFSQFLCRNMRGIGQRG